MALTFFRPRGDVKANWEAANPILKEREMAIEWETAIGVGQPRIKVGKAGGTTHYNDTDYAVLPLKYNTKDGWATDNPILAVGEMGIEWETTIGEGAVCIKFGNGTTAWNSLEYASTGRLKEIIEPETENTPVAVGDTLPMIAGKLNNQQDYLKTKLGYDRLDALAAKLSGLSNQDFVGIMDFINDKKFDKANVYNGVDSTNTKLALAASQGKTLQDQITTLNSNLTTTVENIAQPNLSSSLTITQWIAIAMKSGKVVTLTFNVLAAMQIGSEFVTILCLPDKYKPKNNCYQTYISQEGYPMALIIRTNGNVELLNKSTKESGFILRQTITYLT